MGAASLQGIFLSYRREDTAPYARLLQFQLRERFPDVRVFMDLDSIDAGLDFAEVIREAVDSCTVLVALVGRQWATLTDQQGRRRLDDLDDWVRFEVQTALERGVRVIPVLVDGARPLRQEQLPAGLHKLARLNVLELSYRRYDYDAGRLLDLIQRVLTAASIARNVPEPSPAPKDTGVSEDEARVVRLLIDAERIAQSITAGGQKAIALVGVARALAATGPDRAAGILADAERTARSIRDKTFPDKISKLTALAGVARALAATDPDRAAGMFADAEHIARSITEEKRWEDTALAAVVELQADMDPDGAERIARSIFNEDSKVKALAAVAGALAATDPDRAAGIFADAEHVAESISKTGVFIERSPKAIALSALVKTLAATDPDRAERIAESITDASPKAAALAAVAKALTATDPGRAAGIFADAERVAESSSANAGLLPASPKDTALSAIAKALAATDPDKAERLADSISDDDLKARALVEVARALAATDPDRAERLAQSIARVPEKVQALLAIVRKLSSPDQAGTGVT